MALLTLASIYGNEMSGKETPGMASLQNIGKKIILNLIKSMILYSLKKIESFHILASRDAMLCVSKYKKHPLSKLLKTNRYSGRGEYPY
jgi:hypothetical protein